MVSEGSIEIRGTLTVNTDVVMGYTLAVRASLSLPVLSTERSIEFGLTQVDTTPALFKYGEVYFG